MDLIQYYFTIQYKNMKLMNSHSSSFLFSSNRSDILCSQNPWNFYFPRLSGSSRGRFIYYSSLVIYTQFRSRRLFSSGKSYLGTGPAIQDTNHKSSADLSCHSKHTIKNNKKQYITCFIKKSMKSFLITADHSACKNISYKWYDMKYFYIGLSVIIGFFIYFDIWKVILENFVSTSYADTPYSTIANDRSDINEVNFWRQEMRNDPLINDSSSSTESISSDDSSLIYQSDREDIEGLTYHEYRDIYVNMDKGIFSRLTHLNPEKRKIWLRILGIQDKINGECTKSTSLHEKLKHDQISDHNKIKIYRHTKYLPRELHNSNFRHIKKLWKLVKPLNNETLTKNSKSAIRREIINYNRTLQNSIHHNRLTMGLTRQLNRYPNDINPDRFGKNISHLDRIVDNLKKK